MAYLVCSAKGIEGGISSLENAIPNLLKYNCSVSVVGDASRQVYGTMTIARTGHKIVTLLWYNGIVFTEVYDPENKLVGKSEINALS